VNCFDSKKKVAVDEHISTYLRSIYEENFESVPALQRVLDLSEVYSWLPNYQKQGPDLLQTGIGTSSPLWSLEAQDLAVVAHQALADDYMRNGKYEDAQKLLENLLHLAHGRIPPNDPKLRSCSHWIA
jgi:hypothetical protein